MSHSVEVLLKQGQVAEATGQTWSALANRDGTAEPTIAEIIGVTGEMKSGAPIVLTTMVALSGVGTTVAMTAGLRHHPDGIP